MAFIDFDAAHPGPRLWDLALAAYRFVPLSAPGTIGEDVPVAEQARRLELFTAAYGLTSAADRAMLLAVAQERLVALVEFMRERAAAGDAAFARHCAEGHDAIYRTDLAYLRAHAAALRG